MAVIQEWQTLLVIIITTNHGCQRTVIHLAQGEAHLLSTGPVVTGEGEGEEGEVVEEVVAKQEQVDRQGALQLPANHPGSNHHPMNMSRVL